MSFYPADLARIHDEGFGDFGRAGACELLRRLPAGGLVVELGCGSGITSELLSRAGYEVLGIDISADMLALAACRAPAASFRHESLWEAELPPCVAVTAIGEVLNYQAGSNAGAERLPALFERIYRALRPGGLFLFDFATVGRGTGTPSVRQGGDWTIESVTHEDPTTRTLERRMVIESGEGRREEVHRLHLYDRDFVQKCLEGPGFSSEALDRYCGFGFWPGYAAFAAMRPV